MTDLEMTQLCAEAMLFIPVIETGIEGSFIQRPGYPREYIPYDPLHDDAQAMALVKKCRLWIGGWTEDMVSVSRDGKYLSTAVDLNRAIVECVAKMRVAHTNYTDPVPRETSKPL